MEVYTKESGKAVEKMERENSQVLMALFTKENG
jgi:hypothetical protein